MHYSFRESLPQFREIFPGATREQMFSFILNQPSVGQLARGQAEWERQWFLDGKPFYRVWPKIIPMLLKLDISKVPASVLRLPTGLDRLHIQMPKGNALIDGDDLLGICIGHIDTTKGPGVFIMADSGEEENGFQIFDMWCFENSDTPLEEVLDGLKQVDTMKATDHTRSVVMSLMATLCLIGQDPEMVERILLAKDKATTAEDLQRLADKAKRRGRYGWDIGKGIEVTPHVRRPHPALVWTGKGRKIPKIVMRKSAIVHRNKIESIPTGYENQ